MAIEFRPEVYNELVQRHGAGSLEKVRERLRKPLAEYLDACYTYNRLTGAVLRRYDNVTMRLDEWKRTVGEPAVACRHGDMDVRYIINGDIAFAIWRSMHPLSASSLQPFDEHSYRAAIITAGQGKNIAEWPAAIQEALTLELNKSFVRVRCKGSSYLAVERSDMGGYELERLKKLELAEKLVNVAFVVQSKNEEARVVLDGKRAVEIWCTSPNQNNYVSLTYSPPPRDENTHSDFLNLYDRPGITREEAVQNGRVRRSPHVEAFKMHVRENFCRGNPEHSRWAMGWLAHVVQRPGEKRYSAFVARGNKGSGKSLLAKQIMRIVGMGHCKMPSDPSQVFGRFADMSSCVFAYLNEQFFSGDHAADSALKRIITEEYTDVEKKFKDTFKAQVLCAVFIDGNQQWIVPACGKGERRYFVLDVADGLADWKQAGDERYDQIIAAMGAPDGGELAAGDYDIARYLYEYDLSGFDHSKVPVTEALQDQAEEGLQGFDAWWAGRIADRDHEIFNEEKPISKERLLERYKEETNDNYMNAIRLGKRLKAVVQVMACQSDKRPRYRFPPLEEVINQFERALGHARLCQTWREELAAAQKDEYD